MQRLRIRNDEQGLGFLLKVLILVIALAVVLSVYLNVFAYKSPAPTSATIVEMKDTVTISYVGYFEDSKVFDTSIRTVADDNATWPKALSFNSRLSYEDFTFVAGKTDCSDGATDCAIIGMTKAVLGRRQGDSLTATILPEDGYGEKDPDKLSQKTIVEQIPVRETMNTSTFSTRYRLRPDDGVPIRDPYWGWMVLVHVSGDLITIENSPEISKSYTLYENLTRGGTWSVKVLSIDDSINNGAGAITLMNEFQIQEGNKLMVSSLDKEFFVTDNGDGTYLIDENSEVVGVDLIFYITILDIIKAS